METSNSLQAVVEANRRSGRRCSVPGEEFAAMVEALNDTVSYSFEGDEFERYSEQLLRGE